MEFLNKSLLILALSTSVLAINAQQADYAGEQPVPPINITESHVEINLPAPNQQDLAQPGLNQPAPNQNIPDNTPNKLEQFTNWLSDRADAIRENSKSAKEKISQATGRFVTATGKTAVEFKEYAVTKYNENPRVAGPLLIGTTAGLFAGVATKLRYRWHRRNMAYKNLDSVTAEENRRALYVALLTGTSAAASLALWNIIKARNVNAA